MAVLTQAQSAALDYVAQVAAHGQDSALERIRRVLTHVDCDLAGYLQTMDVVQQHARVVVHFHPDRMTRSGTTVVEGLLAKGVYRNQFETGISAGSTTAYPGGQRDSWEERLFGGSYHARGVAVEQRPKYGALELVPYPDGPIPRFGSCYLVLKPHVSRRTTFTFAGSEDPRALDRAGTIDCLAQVMAALIEEIASGGYAAPPWPPFRAPTLGVANLTVPRLLAHLNALSDARRDPLAPPGRVLDSQIEAQVHGPVRLSDDVEMLVADPSFQRNRVGAALERVAAQFGFPLVWHGGFTLKLADVPDDFRGPAMPALARRIGDTESSITAAVIGAAEASFDVDRTSWADWGTEDEVRLHLKQLWHVLVHHGAWAQRA